MDYAKPTKRHHKWIKCNYDVNLYFRVWKQRWNVYKDKPIENSSELFSCLRNVVNSDSSRMDILTQVIEYHKKVIVFYNFDTELYALRQYCEDNDILYKEWNGHHHQMLPESDVWVYLVQYNAGSEGWNCVETDTVLFWSLNYSYKTLEQSCGRIDRLNTPFQDLYYYHLYSPSQIDKSIKAAIDKKETFSESAFLAAQQKHVT
jgi:superfamily II DNA or RNA helicase